MSVFVTSLTTLSHMLMSFEKTGSVRDVLNNYILCWSVFRLMFFVGSELHIDHFAAIKSLLDMSPFWSIGHADVNLEMQVNK